MNKTPRMQLLTAQKHDPNFRNDHTIAYVGMAIIVLWLLGRVLGTFDHLKSSEFYAYTIAPRMLVAVWVARAASLRNQGGFWWGFWGFFIPAITMIIVGYTKKLTLPFRIDTSYPPQVQYTHLKKLASKMVRRKKHTEAMHVYQYIINHLPHPEADMHTLEELRKKASA